METPIWGPHAAWVSQVCWWVCFQPTLGRLGGLGGWGVAIRGAGDVSGAVLPLGLQLVKGMKVFWRLQCVRLSHVRKRYLWDGPTESATLWSHICVIWSVFSRPSLQETVLLSTQAADHIPTDTGAGRFHGTFPTNSAAERFGVLKWKQIEQYDIVCTKRTVKDKHVFFGFFSSQD